MDEAVPRGSDLLKSQYTEDAFQQLVDVIVKLGLTWQYLSGIGLPPVIDGVWGTVQVTQQQLAVLIQEATQLPVVPTLTITPRGVPAVEAYEVRFQLGSARTG